MSLGHAQEQLPTAGGIGYSAAARWREGRGTARPSDVASSVHAATASLTEASASSGDSPSDMHPGRPGTSATKPPPSLSGSGSMMSGYPSFRIACFPYRIDKPDEAANVDRLTGHGTVRTSPWLGSDTFQCDPPPLGGVHPNSIFAAQRDDVLDRPVAGRSRGHTLDAAIGHQGWSLPGVSRVGLRRTPGLSPLVNSMPAASRAR